MKKKALIKMIQNRGKPREELSPDAVLGFLRVLENMDKEEITCDELYAKLDEYVEREVDQKDAAKIMPLMREHLDVCPECCDEYEALLHVIKESEQKS
jgi:hypothetical protein